MPAMPMALNNPPMVVGIKHTSRAINTGTKNTVVIVGVGSAGCVIANRLTEDPDVSVLLIEAGDWDSQLFLKMPLGMHLMRYPQVNWGYMSEPIPGLGGRALPLPRGKAVGGSSHVNAMSYSRGHPARL